MPSRRRTFLFIKSLSIVLAIVGFVAASRAACAASAPESALPKVVRETQPKVVKIYGAGGFSGLEAYQSGFIVSADGYILTVWSYVLDADRVTVTLDDGRRFKAELKGIDPRLELAVLKIEAADLPYFDLAKTVEAREGSRVLAFSNLFGVATGDEPVSVQRGVLSVQTKLEARRGVFETPYRGPVYVVDAMTNNPGAAGGALTTARGELLAMLGKELLNARNNTWLNYAIPISELREAAAAIQAGKSRPRSSTSLAKVERPVQLAALGILLVPNVLERTPPFVDGVLPDSPAATAGIRPDDLILFVDNQLVQSTSALLGELARIESDQEVRLTLMRGNDLVEVSLKSAEPAP